MTFDIRTRRVKDEMTKVVVSAGPDDEVTEVLRLMAEYRVTALPVTLDRLLHYDTLIRKQRPSF